MERSFECDRFDLLYLPLELVCAVTDAIVLNDLPALRLTCHHLKTLSAKRFQSGYFGERTVFRSIRSLNALVDITNHPEFGPALHTLFVGSHRLPPDVLEDLETDVYDEIHDGPLPIDPERKREILAPLKFLRSRVEEQKSLEEDGTQIMLLTSAMNNIKRLGHSLHLGVGHIKGWGWSDFYDSEGLNFHDAKFSMNSLLSAAAASNIVVNSLHMHLLGGAEFATIHIEPTSRKVIASLEILRITLHSPQTADGFARIIILLNCTRNLRELHIDMADWNEGQVFRSRTSFIRRSINRNSLRSLSLLGYNTSIAELVEILAAQARTLQDLHLHRVRLPEEYHWEALHKWIEDHLSLQRLCIDEPLVDMLPEEVESLDVELQPWQD